MIVLKGSDSAEGFKPKRFYTSETEETRVEFGKASKWVETLALLWNRDMINIDDSLFIYEASFFLTVFVKPSCSLSKRLLDASVRL